MGNHWTLQDAETRFSAVVEAARSGEPQHVTTGGVEAVVVMSAAEYERLTGYGDETSDDFAEHILSFPKLPDDCQDLFDRSEPFALEGRSVDFDD